MSEDFDYMFFLNRVVQWVGEGQKDFSAQTTMKLVKMTEVLLGNIDESKRLNTVRQLNNIVQLAEIGPFKALEE